MKKMRIAAALMAALMVTGCGSSQPSSQPQMNVGIDYNDSSQPETEANSTQSEEAVNDDISVPGLYTEAFQPFYKGMDTLTFDKAKKDVQGISYTAEITNPEGTLTISSDDGDVITAEFCWDMNGVNTLYMLTYTRGDCSFYASSLGHIQEVHYYTIDSSGEKQVDGLADCEKFLFGGSVSSSGSDNSYTVTLLHGTLLEKRAIGDNLTIKAKIQPSFNNKATIDQNYYNIENIIKNQGGTRFTHIDYWAVADMTDGSEKKVISFTLSDETIRKIADNQIVANQMGSYVDDLYILPSLME